MVEVLAVAYKPARSADAGIPVAVARYANRWRGAGFLAGLICAGLSAVTGPRHALLAGAPLFAIWVLGGVLAGELTAPDARPAVRVAGLARRRIRDYVPVLPAIVLTALGGCLALLVAASAGGIAATGQPGAGCLIYLRLGRWHIRVSRAAGGGGGGREQASAQGHQRRRCGVTGSGRDDRLRLIPGCGLWMPVEPVGGCLFGGRIARFCASSLIPCVPADLMI